MRTGLIQQQNGSNTEDNLTASCEGARKAAAQGAKLVVLPELHRSLYFCQAEDPEQFALAEPIPGPTTERLSALAQALDVVLVASLFEARAPGLYHNTAVVIERTGEIAGRYRKMHIPDDPGYYEKYYFTPGDLGFTPIDTSLGRLGILVCWDQWFPEAARLMALNGAMCLIYPTAIGWDPDDTSDEQARQREAWITIQRAHAIANTLPVLCCNRIGTEIGPQHRAHFWGSSFVCGPQGELLAQAPTDEPMVLIADIDPRRTERLRTLWPFLRDRRIDAYADLLLRYKT